MLSTAIVQQDNMTGRGRPAQSASNNNRAAAERSVHSRPPKNNSSIVQQQSQAGAPTSAQVATAQATVIEGQAQPAGITQLAKTSTAMSSRLKGPVCFGERIRSEPFPEDFKGPRKVANYNASMDPTTWLNNYEMGMSILNASEEVCARYLNMMLEGAAHIWLQNLPPNSIHTWDEMKEAFIKNFQGTCKWLCTIEDLERCV